MKIGAQDNIDKMLVKLYSDVKTNNVGKEMTPDQVLNCMHVIGIHNMHQSEVSKRLCSRKRDVSMKIA